LKPNDELPSRGALELNEVVSMALANDRVHWCRARLLHALAGAAKQGVLDEVLNEILPDDGDAIAQRIVESLKASGWMKST
jgi:hypothetical protein